MARTRIDGFLDGAAINIDAVDALEAISAQLEVVTVALFALGRECGIRNDISFRAVVTVFGDIHETLDALKDSAKRLTPVDESQARVA